MVQWVIHLKDGESLTDDVLYPHEMEILKARGYEPGDITAVDRIVGGTTLTLRAQGLDTFFVGTDTSLDLAVAGAIMKSRSPEITKRFLGAYIKDVDPPLQVRLGMDPRSKNIFVETVKVKNKAPTGINAQLWEPTKFLKNFQRGIDGKLFTIMDARYIADVKDVDGGFVCALKEVEKKMIFVHLKTNGVILEIIEEKPNDKIQ